MKTEHTPPLRQSPSQSFGELLSPPSPERVESDALKEILIAEWTQDPSTLPVQVVQAVVAELFAAAERGGDRFEKTGKLLGFESGQAYAEMKELARTLLERSGYAVVSQEGISQHQEAVQKLLDGERASLLKRIFFTTPTTSDLILETQALARKRDSLREEVLKLEETRAGSIRSVDELNRLQEALAAGDPQIADVIRLSIEHRYWKSGEGYQIIRETSEALGKVAKACGRFDIDGYIITPICTFGEKYGPFARSVLVQELIPHLNDAFWEADILKKLGPFTLCG
jgi:hypothetical protein